jgi:RNA polymerase sigma factor (sigma-70 family)
MEVSLDRHSEAWNERSLPEPSDPGANQLHQLLQRELESILSECFPKLDSEYQAVLRLRGAGMKYDEIAVRLGQKENTVATWLSRAIRDLAGCIKRRMQRIGKK